MPTYGVIVHGISTNSININDQKAIIQLRIDNKRLKSELKAVLGVSAGDATESDTEGQSKKRSRGEAGFEGTAGDTAKSDMEDGIKKRGRQET